MRWNGQIIFLFVSECWWRDKLIWKQLYYYHLLLLMAVCLQNQSLNVSACLLRWTWTIRTSFQVSTERIKRLCPQNSLNFDLKNFVFAWKTLRPIQCFECAVKVVFHANNAVLKWFWQPEITSEESEWKTLFRRFQVMLFWNGVWCETRRWSSASRHAKRWTSFCRMRSTKRCHSDWFIAYPEACIY